MSRILTFGWNAARLADHSFDDLRRLREQIEADPRNRNPVGTLWIYTKAAQKKLDAIAWAITYKLAEARKAAS